MTVLKIKSIHLILKNESKIKAFSDIQQLKEFIISQSALQENGKKTLEAEILVNTRWKYVSPQMNEKCPKW